MACIMRLSEILDEIRLQGMLYERFNEILGAVGALEDRLSESGQSVSCDRENLRLSDGGER